MAHTPRVCVLLAHGFEEIEAITIIDVLRRAQIEVVTVGVEGSEVRGAHDIVVQADQLLPRALEASWDMVILPGGPASQTLRDDERVQDLVRRQAQLGKRLAAICAAPIALGRAGVLQGKRATAFPGYEGELGGATFVDERVVEDGLITTSRGPGTALEFSLALVRTLVGDALADKIGRTMLVRA